ncbi:fibronectin type III domain-containing protein [Gynuella sp.]|uniref:fibronectin type III domain-containing protein n=1 Tax=Gynuella sp. TaxID=2969146 RepID=UPI003D0C3A3F
MKVVFPFTTTFFFSLILSGCQLEASDHSKLFADPARLVRISWDTPERRENGESLYAYEIEGYEIKYRKMTDQHYQYRTLWASDYDGLIEETAVSVAGGGSYEFAVAVFDGDGLYSQYSDAVIVTLD